MAGNNEYRRPDLEALEVNPGFRYIGPKIFPVLNKPQKSGTLYYQDLPSDQAAQTGRTAGAAPTSGNETASSGSYSTAERINRRRTPDDEDALMGGVESVYRRMTTVSKRSIMRATEDLVVAASLNNASVTVADIMSSIRQAMDTAVDTIHRYPGRLIAACGWTTYRRLTRYTELTGTLLRLGVPTEREASSILQAAPFKLAEILGLEELLVGDDDHWTAGRLLVMKEVPGAPTANVVSPDMEVQAGRIVQYLPDGETSPVQIDAYFDKERIAYTVQGRVWNVTSALNTGAMYILKGIDEGNATTTTSTTTTTTS